MNAMCHGIRTKFSDVSHLETDLLAKWIKNSEAVDEKGNEKSSEPLLFDVREEEEFAISHLKESIRVSPSAGKDQVLDLLREHLNRLTHNPQCSSDQTTKIVCYCSLGYRSSALAKMITEIGTLETLPPFKVYNLEGSIFKWANENRPLVNPEGQPTKFVHPYNFVFGALLNKDLRKY